ncbi:hypothetical protein G647_09843 [Cladophialophora carrionii CBS 160.54]|uniref:Alpha/beta hydrolase fold-3 domain-containing protein n=1 Tax=Cladophialophora carrionii CBS 160.54 TaxID=1279043 RepID=V9DKD6_9EURO|nr:uncharacterized protein G647_09843 [Cladophialophora carrionii CBS 160.54]ETI27161.1 hypothetical protein G647_09843 [Cladophialophora carrionii CBS 160.54]
MPKFFVPRPEQISETRRLHARGNVRFMQSAFVKETLGEHRLWTEEDRPVMVRDGNLITVRIYRPSTLPGARPVMVFAHSGGWCMGGLDTEEFICQLLCIKLGIIVVNVGYRLAPEWRFPTPILDLYDVLKWVSVNAEALGGDLSKGFLTGGASAGGNVTSMAAIQARDEHLQPRLTGHLFLCTGMPHSYIDSTGDILNLFPEQLAHGSWEKYKSGPVATREMNVLYGYIAGFKASHPSPLKLTDFSGLGPVYYQAAEMDIWRDSAVFYCDKIRQAGDQAKIDIYPGVPHLWWAMYPQLSINKKWVKDLVDGVEWLLKQNRDPAKSSRL